jgi:hypothetical protein
MRRRIRPEDLRALPGLSRHGSAALLAEQPTSVREALGIPGVGRKTTCSLLIRGLVDDPEDFQIGNTTRRKLPLRSAFYGIVVQMFWREHGPPHFHATYGQHEAIIDIRELRVTRGELPRRALALVLEWAAKNRHSLMENWELCRQLKPLTRSRPWNSAATAFGRALAGGVRAPGRELPSARRLR